MARKKRVLTGSYEAKDVADGKIHVVNIFTDMIEVAPLSGPIEWIPGLQSHKMQSNGNHVNVDGNDLEEVATGRKMTRNS
jgi:hypothetical protein